MEFPHPFTPDPTHRGGRMMLAGRVKVTVTEDASHKHITVLLKCIADNRKRQFRADKDKNWIECVLSDCTHLFVEVPNQSGYNDKVGTYYPGSGRWYDADNADPSRVAAAKMAALWLMYQLQVEALHAYSFVEADECGICGKELTDPESVARGIGPTCFGAMTSSEHQHKNVVELPVLPEQTPQEEFTFPETVTQVTDKWTSEGFDPVLDNMSDLCSSELKIDLTTLDERELSILYHACLEEHQIRLSRLQRGALSR